MVQLVLNLFEETLTLGTVHITLLCKFLAWFIRSAKVSISNAFAYFNMYTEVVVLLYFDTTLQV